MPPDVVSDTNPLMPLDVFAEANPAFLSTILWSFLTGYGEAEGDGCDIPLAFLPIPILLCRDLAATFAHTNATTGFVNWLTRNQVVIVGLASRIEMTSHFTRQALLFGIRYGLIELGEGGRFRARTHPRVTSRITHLPNETKDPILLAKRLGIWLGRAGTTSGIYHALGLTL